MSPSAPETVIAIYRVHADQEAAFLDVLRRHWPTLEGAGLVTDDPPIVYRGAGRDGAPIVFEIFTWKDGDAPNTAHELPEVMALWEPMGKMCEERDGAPGMEFPHVTKLDLGLAGA